LKVADKLEELSIFYPIYPIRDPKKRHIEDSKQKTHWRFDNIFNINANNL